ncbi:MAG: helix-turn-helix domain-containing protein, partial [Planctomycetaceae bacterium]
MPDDRDRLLAEEAASQLKLSIDELKDLRRKGRIRGYPNYGAWVFERDDVARLAEEMGIEAPPTDPTAEETA